jgi:acetyl esterase/lipase
MKNKVTLQITVVFLVLLGLLISTANAAEPNAKTELLWPGGAPGAKGNDANDKPTMAIYLPAKEKTTGSAVVIFPGGGYQRVAIDHEGRQVARWLNDLGIAAFVVDYRHRGRGYGNPAPIQDAQRAIRIVRSRSAEFGIETNKIGIIGFSAGGHLASTAGTHFNEKFYEPVDANDGTSARPDFMILIYPVISLGPFAHSGSRISLLGNNVSQEQIDKFSNEKQVDSNTPPTFLVHATDDKTVPAENSIYFYLACKKAHVPVEMHLWQKGEHGFGLGKSGTPVSRWPVLCADWMDKMGLCSKKAEQNQ